MGWELTNYLQINITFIGLRSYGKTKKNRQRPIKDFDKA